MKAANSKSPPPAPDSAAVIRARLLVAAAFLAFTVLFFFNLPVYFVTDDLRFLEKTFDVGLAASLDPTLPRNFYRPLTQDLYFRVLFALFGMRPSLFHLVNLFFMGANVGLVFALARRLTGKIEAAAWAAFLFVITLINFRIYFWISCIQDIMMTTLALAAVLCFLAGRDGGPRARVATIAGPVLFGLSLLAKESALLLPLWLWFYELVDGGRKDGMLRSWRRHWGFDLVFVAFVLFSLLRPLPLDNPYRIGHPLWMVTNLGAYLFAFWLTVGFGLVLDSPVTYGHAGLGLSAAAVSWLAARRLLGRRPANSVLLGLVWFGLGLLIFLPLADRMYVYYISFASVGAWWALGEGLATGLARLRFKASLIAALVIIALFLASGARNYTNLNESYLRQAAAVTGQIHGQLKAQLPNPAPGQCIVIYTQLDLTQSDLIGLRALYHRPDLKVFVDRQAWQDLPDGRSVGVKPEFKNRGCRILFYDEQRGLVAGR